MSYGLVFPLLFVCIVSFSLLYTYTWECKWLVIYGMVS